jgi:hypothetical protein
MGGEYRTIRVIGKDFNSAWSAEQEIEKEERGSDFYNGSIHHVDDIRMMSESQYDDAIKNDVSIYKCSGIAKKIRNPIPNTNKIKTTVENFPQKGTRKWETRYVVREQFYYEDNGSYKTQTEAVKAARSLCEKTHKTYIVEIEKILVGNKHTTSRIAYQPSSSQRDGKWEVYCLVPW